MVLDFASLLSAFGITFSLTPVIKKVVVRLGVLDHPDPRKIHSNPVPLLGSIGVFAGFLAGIFLAGFDLFLHRELFILLLAATFLLMVGVLDDAKLLHHQIKLMGAMPVAGLILVSSDLGLTIFPFQILNYFFTLFWVVGITAAYNLLDGMDGLSTGVCVIASLFYLVFGMITGDYPLIWIAASLAGACLGFLVYNFHPAKIFLGDGGAMFLGFLLASMGLRVANSESLPVLTRWMIPILIVAVPIFDTSLVTFSRVRRGLIPFLTPGKDHSHHRLYNLKLGQRGAVLILYSFGMMGGLFSLLIYSLGALFDFLIFGFLILGGLGLIYLFEQFPFERQELIKKDVRS